MIEMASMNLRRTMNFPSNLIPSSLNCQLTSSIHETKLFFD